MYVRLAEALAAAGIGSLRLDFRGCGDSEGDFRNNTFKDQVDDAMLGLRFLEQDPHVETSRIGLLGRSLGGPVAVVAARQHGAIRSLALWAAVFHGAPWRRQWDEARRQGATVIDPAAPIYFQGHPMNPELFIQLLNLDMVQELESLHGLPLFCVHSEGDEVVDMTHAEHFRNTRQKASAMSQFIRLNRSSHDFSDRAEQDQTIRETVEWYRQTL